MQFNIPDMWVGVVIGAIAMFVGLMLSVFFWPAALVLLVLFVVYYIVRGRKAKRNSAAENLKDLTYRPDLEG